MERAHRMLPTSLLAMLAASVSPTLAMDHARYSSGSRGPVRSRKRGGGRGGRNLLDRRNAFKLKNITGVEVARPRHASSSYMGPNSEHSKWIFAECAKRNGGQS